MIEVSIPAHSSQRSAGRRIGRLVFWLLSALIAMLLLMATVGPGLFELGMILVVGWTQFLVRTVPNTVWNWDLIGMGFLCLTLILLLAHYFLNWIAKSIGAARGSAWRWPWKWTCCGLSAVVVFFLVGMAIGGTVHQIGWIASSPEPWYERKRGAWENLSDMKQLDGAFHFVLEDVTNNLAAARHEMWNPRNEVFPRRSGEPPLMQRYHFLLIMDDNEKAAGVIIFPRDATRRAETGGMYSFGQKFDHVPVAKLPEVIRIHQAQIITL